MQSVAMLWWLNRLSKFTFTIWNHMTSAAESKRCTNCKKTQSTNVNIHHMFHEAKMCSVAVCARSYIALFCCCLPSESVTGHNVVFPWANGQLLWLWLRCLFLSSPCPVTSHNVVSLWAKGQVLWLWSVCLFLSSPCPLSSITSWAHAVLEQLEAKQNHIVHWVVQQSCCSCYSINSTCWNVDLVLCTEIIPFCQRRCIVANNYVYKAFDWRLKQQKTHNVFDESLVLFCQPGNL